MLRQSRKSINIISMSMSQMDIAINQRKLKAQGEAIHQLTSQTPHLPQLKLKFDPLMIP